MQEQSGEPAVRPTWRRVALRVFVGGLFLAGLGFTVVLQTSWGTQAALTRIAAAILSSDDVHVEAATIGGSRLTSLRVTGLRVQIGDSEPLVEIDSLELRYRFLPLLRRAVMARAVTLTGPYLDLRECGLLRHMSAEGDSGWILGADRIVIDGGRIAGGGCAGDDTWVAEGLDVRAAGIRGTPPFEASVEALRSSIKPAGTPDGYEVDIEFEGELAAGILRIETATLRSPQSDVTARGLLRPWTAPTGTPDVDFTLRAEPLALRDLQPFTDLLSEEGSARLDARFTTEGDRLNVDGDLALQGGGSVAFGATLAEADDEVLRYRGTGRASGFHAAALFRDAPLGEFDAALDFDLAGPSLDLLSGSAALAAQQVRSEPNTALDMGADATFADGRADVSGFVELAQGRGTFAGWIRPFTDRREAELGGDFSLLIEDAPGARTELLGAFDLTVAADTLGASGRGVIRLRDSSFRSASVQRAALDVTFADGQSSWVASASVGEGHLDATGTSTLSAEPELRVEAGSVRDLNLAALLGLSRPARLNATFAGSRDGGIAGLGSGTAELALSSSTLGLVSLDNGRIFVEFDGDEVEAEVRADLLSGSVDGHVVGLLGEGVRVAVTRGGFEGLDLSGLSEVEPGLSRLTGSVTGEWNPQGNGVGRVDVALRESELRRMPVDSAVVTVRIAGDSVAVEGQVDSPRGELQIRGSRTSSMGVVSWLVDEAIFANLDIGALLESGESSSVLSGRIRGSWSGAELATGNGEARLVVGPSVLGDRSVDAATVAVDIEDGRSVWVAEVDAEGWTGRVDAAIEALEGANHFGGTAAFRGTAAGVDVDSAIVVGFYRDGTIRADTLHLWSRDALVEGRGGVEVRPGPVRLTDLSVVAMFSGAELLGRWVAPDLTTLEEAHATVVANAVGDSVEVSAEVSALGVTYRGAGANSLVGTGNGFLKPDGGISGLRAQGGVTGAQAGNVPFESISVSGESQADGLLLTADAVVDAGRRGRGMAWVGFSEEGTELQVQALRLDWGSQIWTLDGVPNLHFGERVVVRDFALTSESGRISVDGTLDPSGNQQLQGAVQGVQLAGLSDFIGYSDLSGALDGSLDLSGSAEAPILTGLLSTRGASIGSTPVVVRASAHFENRALDLSAVMDFDSLGTGDLTGRIPLQFTMVPGDSSRVQWASIPDGAVDLDFRTDGLSLGLLSPWLASGFARDVGGSFDTDLRATGTPAAPLLEGSLAVVGVDAYLPGLGVRLREGRLSGRFEEDRLVIDTAEILSGTGSLSVSGVVRARGLAASDLELLVVADEFSAARTDLFQAVIDGDLVISGDTERPIVSGTVDVLSGDVFLGGRFASTRAEVVELTGADYAMLADRFGYEPPAASPLNQEGGGGDLAVNVNVRLGRDVWVRQKANPALSVQFTGEARIEKDAGELERVYGTLEAVPRGSYVEQFGRRFAITSGTVVFAGPPNEFRMDVRGEYAVPSRGDPSASEVVIGLGVVGGLNDLGLVLSSEPELENPDIVSYLATGRPASQTFDSPGGSGLVERGATMALGRATGAVERLASENIGLDVMQIRSDGSRGVTVVAGRYVSPRLYLGFTQPIGYRRGDSSATAPTRSPEVEIEYQAFRWLLLNLQRNGSRLDFFLRSRYAY